MGTAHRFDGCLATFPGPRIDERSKRPKTQGIVSNDSDNRKHRGDRHESEKDESAENYQGWPRARTGCHCKREDRRQDAQGRQARHERHQQGQERGGTEEQQTTQMVELLRRENGATLDELVAFTGWKANSVRGFLSGTIGKKMGLKLESTKGEDGQRKYQVAS